jgi:hypothetical protein
MAFLLAELAVGDCHTLFSKTHSVMWRENDIFSTVGGDLNVIQSHF